MGAIKWLLFRARPHDVDIPSRGCSAQWSNRTPSWFGPNAMLQSFPALTPLDRTVPLLSFSRTQLSCGPQGGRGGLLFVVCIVTCLKWANVDQVGRKWLDWPWRETSRSPSREHPSMHLLSLTGKAGKGPLRRPHLHLRARSHTLFPRGRESETETKDMSMSAGPSTPSRGR